MNGWVYHDTITYWLAALSTLMYLLMLVCMDKKYMVTGEGAVNRCSEHKLNLNLCNALDPCCRVEA